MFFVHNQCNLLYDIKYILGIAINTIVSIVITMMASDACHLGPPLTNSARVCHVLYLSIDTSKHPHVSYLQYTTGIQQGMV